MESSWNPALRPDTEEPSAQNEAGGPGKAEESPAIVVGERQSNGEDVGKGTVMPAEVEKEANDDLQDPENAVPKGLVNEHYPDTATNTNTMTEVVAQPVNYATHLQNGGTTQADIEATEQSVLTLPDFSSFQPLHVPSRSHPLPGNVGIEEAFAAATQGPKQHHPVNSEEAELFPDVSPLPLSSAIEQAPLPKSEAEAIVEENELADRQQSANFDTAAGENFAANQGASETLDSPPDADELFSSAASVRLRARSLSAEQEQARFVEGLPLVAEDDGANLSLGRDYFTTHKDVSQDLEDHATIFGNDSQLGKSSENQAPHPIHRKSTTQVLDSMQFTPYEVSYVQERGTRSSPTLKGAAVGGLEDFDEGGKPAENSKRNTGQSDVETKEDDLSDLWRAALGDDDMLDESYEHADPSSFFNDDGEGFLDDIADTEQAPVHPVGLGASPASQALSNFNVTELDIEQSEPSTYRPSNSYVPRSQAPQPYSQGTFRYVGQPQMDPSNLLSATSGLPYAPQYQQPTLDNSTPARPQLRGSTQSFVDKSKGGYQSPYDLPMDVTRPRKRANPAPAASTTPAVPAVARPPPPRRSSLLSSQGAQVLAPSLSNQDADPAANIGPPGPSVVNSKPKMGSFFEELPLSRSRPSGGLGRASAPVSQSLPQPKPPLGQGQDPSSISSARDYQLVPPERLGLYDDGSSQQSSRHAVPAVNSRYSPAPVQPSSVPPPSNRYASSPAAAPRPPSLHAIQHQPRTSSPLTQGSMNAQQQLSPIPSDPYGQAYVSTSDGVPQRQAYRSEQRYASMSQLHPYPQPAENQASVISNQSPSTIAESAPPLPPTHTATCSISPSASPHTTYTPGPDQSSQGHDSPSHELATCPPKRPKTQSPDASKSFGVSTEPRTPYRRPASVNNYVSQLASQGTSVKSAATESYRTVQNQVVDYIRPTDGRETDELERWKGCPIFSFGFGGKVVRMFPQHIPRYAAGQKHPLTKCSPGEVKTESDETLSGFRDSVAGFPGPLKGKGKKKEVLEWLKKKLADLQNRRMDHMAHHQGLPDPIKCWEERILLWKVVSILVEFDGTVEGNPNAEYAVRTVLSPELKQGNEALIPQNVYNNPLLGITKRSVTSEIPGAGGSQALEELRKRLLVHGQREQAVWYAVDNRLWAHAMLISSTLNLDLQKQVAQEFVRVEVKTSGDNTESLATLYQIFAGNWEESVDELVPPSARAGLQMVSKNAGTSPTKNALDGLDRWRETLTLILSNRTAGDSKALVALGQLLASYGRTEAAHICYIFAKTPGLFGGPDDPQVSFALLGADYMRQPFNFGRDFDSILLTEVFDFSRTAFSTSSASAVSPHLQSYRLYHAIILAEYGFRPEALQYCDAVFSSLKSTTRPSPYYHGLLMGTLETLQDRLRQAPHDTSGSWISRPSIDKVSGSIWAKFNSYVAGDDDDATSTSAGKVPDPAAGPFAGVAGDSSALSRAPSSGDLHHHYDANVSYNPTPFATTSSYTPGGLYTFRTSSEQRRQANADYSRPSGNETLRPGSSSYQYSRPTSSAGLSSRSYVSRPQSSGYAPRTQGYLPTPPMQPENQAGYVPDHDYNQDAFQASLERAPVLVQGHHRPSTPQGPLDSRSHQSQISHESLPQGYPSDTSYERPAYEASSFQPPTHAPSSYEPPIYEQQAQSYETTSSYEPPSSSPGTTYQPYESFRSELSPVRERTKVSVMNFDEDNGFEARAVALSKEEKVRKDREADETFRKAAEADSRKDEAPKLSNKKSWFGGGWFSGSKEKANETGTPNAPIKVKLGEESSFYFDKELGKWVNKKGSNAESAAAPAAPPPKGPSRAVSAAAGPPMRPTPTPPLPPLPAGRGGNGPPVRALSGPSLSQPPASIPPSRTSSPAKNQTRAASEAAPAFNPPSAPPSRPATGQGGATDIDDLYGASQARKGGTVKKGKKGRGYVDVMAR